MGEFQCFPMDKGIYAPAPNVIGGWLVTSWFGGRKDPITGKPGNHGGDDLFNGGQTHLAPFYAVKSGRVSQGRDGSGGGLWTSLFCDDGDYVGYGHADHFEPGVNGTHVEAGQILGYIDSTGASTGSHMHFALNIGGRGAYDDPTDYLINAASAGLFPNPIPGMPTIPDVPNNPSIPEGDFDMGSMTPTELEDLMLGVINKTVSPWEKDTRKYMGHTICQDEWFPPDGSKPGTDAAFYIDADATGAPVRVHISDEPTFWMMTHARFLSSGPTYDPRTFWVEGDTQETVNRRIDRFRSLPVVESWR